jgi:hypothetical protein
MNLDKITTAVVYNPDGTFRHVPTSVVVIDGSYYAKVNSLTNSVYSFIYNPIEIDAISGEWYEEAINELTSRTVILADEEMVYNEEISRGKFIYYLMSALGLENISGSSASVFLDVPGTSLYNDAINLAYEYDFIDGYGNGLFGIDDTLTREQAMIIFYRVMEQFGFTDDQLVDVTVYLDYDLVSSWAKESVSSIINMKVVIGTSDTTLSPQKQLSIAEGLQMIYNLLKESELID